MDRTLIATVADRPGVLNRVASLFRRRAFNIESLTVGHTERSGVSRMTIVVDGRRTDATKVAQNLEKLVDVLDVEDITDRPSILHDLAGSERKIDTVVEALRSHGILEMVRTGRVAMVRGEPDGAENAPVPAGLHRADSEQGGI